MPRPHAHQGGARRALASYLARRRRQFDRVWEGSPVAFLDRLGFDVSRLVSRRFTKPVANWQPGEFREAPSLPEDELSFETAPEEPSLGESFQPGVAEAPTEAAPGDVIEALAPSASDQAAAPEDVVEIQVEDASGASPSNTASAPVESSTNAPPPSRAVEPASNRRRARVEEIIPTRAPDAGPVPQMRAPTAQRGGAPNAGNSATDEEQIDPARLFEPTTERDLSPAAWARRLAMFIAEEQRAKPAAHEKPLKPQPAASEAAIREKTDQTAATPAGREATFIPPERLEPAGRAETLSEPARRFLRPLIGFDPADVPIVRGNRAEKVIGELQADAATIGETIVIGSGFPNESPEQLGVLAHELTHVARRRQPRFVPPIAREVQKGGASFAPSTESPDEESLARRVEGRVIRAAEQFWPALGDPPGATETEASMGRGPGKQQQGETIGGALPAPWESLTEWAGAPAGAPQPMPAGPGAISQSISPSPPGLSAGEAPVFVQLAERGRTVESQTPPPQTTPPVPVKSLVAPDLDALARQVYTLLKRRLANEQRREFCA